MYQTVLRLKFLGNRVGECLPRLHEALGLGGGGEITKSVYILTECNLVTIWVFIFSFYNNSNRDSLLLGVNFLKNNV